MRKRRMMRLRSNSVFASHTYLGLEAYPEHNLGFLKSNRIQLFHFGIQGTKKNQNPSNCLLHVVVFDYVWSHVCPNNMAMMAREATTMRRILESLFRCFDNKNLWPSSRGVAYPVLKNLQTLIDESSSHKG